LYGDKVGAADADDVERAQARRSAGAGVAGRFQQADASVLVSVGPRRARFHFDGLAA
jgi:hypothetical protein